MSGIANQTDSTGISEKKKFGAKNMSKGSMLFSGVWIAGLTLLKGAGKISLTIQEIIYSGIAIAAVWTPTYFSILLDKIRDIKIGGGE